MNISQYWQLPIQEKEAIYRDVIKPVEYCEECGKSCTEDGVTCWWCKAVVCPEHAINKQWNGRDIQVCKSCYSCDWRYS